MRTKFFRLTNFSLGFLMLFTFGFVGLVNAVSVTPSSGSLTAGATETLELIAAPTESNQNAVVLRLSVTGMSITGYTDPSGFLGVIGECSGGTKFTSTQICASLAKTSSITAGESLGTITVQVGNSGTATITKDTGNSYNFGTESAPDVGQAASYTITTSDSGGTGDTGNTGGTGTTGGTTVLPNTSVSRSNTLFIAIGLTFISLGALSYVSIDSLKIK
jgi:LPXTG-motif cell wall-anchored protein